MEKTIYLDHAATSWPKPPGVGEAMMNTLEFAGANPGRGVIGWLYKPAGFCLKRERLSDSVWY